LFILHIQSTSYYFNTQMINGKLNYHKAYYCAVFFVHQLLPDPDIALSSTPSWNIHSQRPSIRARYRVLHLYR
jgi:hypothetical protein